MITRELAENGNRRKNRNMADAGNEDTQHQEPEEHEDNEAGDNKHSSPYRNVPA